MSPRQAARAWEKRDIDAILRACPDADASNEPMVLHYAALAHSSRKHLREAVECWRRALDLDSHAEEPLRALAYELADRGPLSEAVRLLELLVAQRLATADDLTTLSEVLIAQGRAVDARQYLRRALDLEPKNSLALVATALLYAQLGETDLALNFLARASETGEIDLSDLRDDPDFMPLWRNPQFELLTAPN